MEKKINDNINKMLSEIEFLNFKIHKTKTIKFNKSLTLLYGFNGSGKTSVLEAISLFTSGKGIFHLTNEELITFNKDHFSIKIELNHANFQIKFHKKKEIWINNSISTATNLLEHISILGLTPYSALAFWQDSSLRRKMINRIILQHNPTYGKIYNQYIRTLKQRNLLITNKTFNNKWREILDPIIKENGLKINDIRKNILSKLLNNQSKEIQNFIKDEIKIQMIPSFEEQEAIFSTKLDENFIGPHQSKFIIITKKNLALSTGQQKKILLSFLLMSLNLCQNKCNLLLLDDVLSHLDNQTIIELLTLLSTQNIQTIITHITKIEHNNVENIELTL